MRIALQISMVSLGEGREGAEEQKSKRLGGKPTRRSRLGRLVGGS